ncbi:hypothetical protein H8M03_06305 [Sphingomonas sabuli]|uniref:LPXTG cell wall anchor domain-containing protein n=1 Tax=Sphingomonas sabuli TaxID=2764186 RepID=A0A7G9KZ90_9SPHN|nr:hypothetical protein [Sphingomonas sabuli]QNM81689.1 hypothetical protein H8M03_06305 [Sphingomonas sabuli]
MKARALFAASVGLSIAVSPAVAMQAAPAQNGSDQVITLPPSGDFSLNGTVTRRPTPTPDQTPPARQPAPRPAPTQPTAEPAPQRPQPAPRPEAPSPAVPAAPSATAPAVTQDAPAQPQPQPSTTAPSFSDISGSTAAGGIAAAPEQTVESTTGLSPMLPWFVALLGLAGVGAFVFFRQRQRPGYAGAPGETRFDVEPEHQAPVRTPAPIPVRPAPVPVPAAAPAEPAPAPEAKVGPDGTIVSTRLRPWLDFEFTPRRTIIEKDVVAVEFDVSVFNSGSVPARNVLVEARLFNASPDHLSDLRKFYIEPVAQGSRVPTIDPLQRVSVSNAVALRRSDLEKIEVDGRELLVPLVAFNALYSWSNGKGQTSSAFIVGKDTHGDRLSPFRLDENTRAVGGLAARDHDLRIKS